MLRQLCLFLAVVICVANAAMTDPATGIAFTPKINDLSIFGVGVRKKGPIKIYSVGMYCGDAIKDILAGISKGPHALATCANKAENITFLLQMNFKVGAEKMASALCDAVTPRHTGSSGEVHKLKELIVQGFNGEAAVKGSKLQFDCSPTGIQVAIDGRTQGMVESNALAKAFSNVFLDDNAVSPALRNSILDNWCGVDL